MAYFDAASTEPLHPAARETLLAALEDGWADPARLYREGRQAALLLAAARERVAAILACRADEVSFTASGTDAVHRGLLGMLRAQQTHRAAHSAVEHSAVLHALEWWQGEADSVPVDRVGRIAGPLPDAGVVALEGLDLRAVEPGWYELLCLPLKVVASDGAPARALLRTL